MKIVHQQNKCIGCGSCVAVCPDFWITEDDGKVKLKGSKERENKVFELEVDSPGCNKEAESVCPVQCIKIE